MDRVLKALKCVNCEEILRTPIILPCGHMICESHTLETNDLIICSKCGSRHPIKEFVIVEAVSDMIDAQLGHIDFGEQHTEALNSCKSLKKQIDQIDLMLNDLDYYIHETISEMKNRVILKSEQLKFKIEQVTNILIDDLEEYEKSCIRDCGENSIDDLQERNEELRKNLQEWSSVLNELKVDVKRWSGIKSECDESLRSMREKFKNFEKKVFMDELIGKKHQVALFERQIIDPFLTLKKTFLESNIILESEILPFDFFDLCNFKPERDQFKLLYRGSRDGFAALDFHTKCDFLPSTLTLVETSLGYIFGGYTHACWTTGSGKSHYDPRAFLFSLVNKFGKPFVCKIADTKNAIYSRTSYGPTFGTNDIFICNNSNTESKSNVGLASYQKPDDIDDPNGVYFCDSRYFQVKEMEVFQIEST